MYLNKIAYLAKVKGMKHNYLARKCGVSEQTFSRWATNQTQPDLTQAAVLARLLDVKLDDLIEEEDR
jgi:transcriptional regulator with XRE-family HTH domain